MLLSQTGAMTETTLPDGKRLRRSSPPQHDFLCWTSNLNGLNTGLGLPKGSQEDGPTLSTSCPSTRGGHGSHMRAHVALRNRTNARWLLISMCSVQLAHTRSLLGGFDPDGGVPAKVVADRTPGRVTVFPSEVGQHPEQTGPRHPARSVAGTSDFRYQSLTILCSCVALDQETVTPTLNLRTKPTGRST